VQRGVNGERNVIDYERKKKSNYDKGGEVTMPLSKLIGKQIISETRKYIFCSSAS